MKRGSWCLPLWVFTFMAVTWFSETTAGEILDNPKLVRLLESKLQLSVLEKKIEISTCQFNTDTEAIILVSQAAQKGGMLQTDVDKLLLLIMDKAGEESKRLKNLAELFFNKAINRTPENMQEYEAALREVRMSGKAIVPYVMDAKYMEAEDELKREAALHALRLLGDDSEKVAQRVKLMLDDRHPAVRRQAAEAVAALAGPKTCDDLITDLVRPKTNNLDGIAMALGYLGNPSAVEPLTTLLSKSMNQDARLAAAFSLGLLRTGDKQTIAVLLEAILDDRDDRLRVAAAAAAGEIGSPETVSYVKRAYQRYRSGRAELIMALKHIKNAETVEFLISECAGSDDAKVRTAAILTLKVLCNENYGTAEEWESWWSINKDTPEWIKVRPVETTANNPGK